MSNFSGILDDQRDAPAEAHLFLDTNVLIYYAALDGLDWSGILGTKSTIVLHIVEPVLEEIAKKKDMGETKQLRKRCDRLVKRISELLERDDPIFVSGGVRLVVDAKAPKMQAFPELNALSADDRLLACALSFGRSTGLHPVIITADVSLALRAKLRGLQLQNITLGEAERLSPEADREELEKRELERQLAAIAAAQPKVCVQFDTGGPLLRLKKRPARNDLLAEMLEKQRAKFPFSQMPKPMPGTVSLEFFNQQEVDAYNAALEEYFREYQQWLEKCGEIAGRSHDVGIVVSNEGSSPAFAVHLRLHFPDGLTLVQEEEFEDLLPEEPLPPEKPRDWMTRIAEWRVPIAQPRIPDIKPVFASEHMSIRKTNSFDVDWEAKKIRQRETKQLPKMVLVYDAQPFSFTIQFEFVADNLPDAANGSLHIQAGGDE